MRKNLKKIPKTVLAKMDVVGDAPFVVACVKRYSKLELDKGMLSSFGIHLDDIGTLKESSTPMLPPKTAGKFSRRNILGYSVIRKDLPKEPRLIKYHVKDWYDQWHEGYYQRFCYVRQRIEPCRHKIIAKVVANNEHSLDIGFQIDKAFRKNEGATQLCLLECVNILWENVGKVGIELADAPISSYICADQLQWQVFPRGEMDPETLALAMTTGRTTESREERLRVLKDHITFLKNFNPIRFVQGLDSFGGYIGAELPNNVYVFDCALFGNAIYILKENWEELSKKSRIELLRDYKDKIQRIPHTKNWKCRLLAEVRKLQ